MSGPARHGLLVALPALALVPALLAAASTPANPDAALIAACDAYRDLMDAVNRGDDGNDDNGLAWRAYEACRDTVTDGEPQTMAGVLAKARAVKVEGRMRDGSEQLSGTMAEGWALDVVNALLRLEGVAA